MDRPVLGAVLEDKLADAIRDPDFEKLELIMREPNVFRALSIERHEIRHSNFFAYLLNPRENHGLGELVLRKFLRDIFSDERAQERSIFDADLLKLNEVDIRREWRNIDILVDLPNDVVVIENKVDSVDHTNQLKRYKATIDAEFHHKRRHFVYLTPFGSDPTDPVDQKLYITYSHEQIADIIKTILDLYSDSIGSKVRYYLTDYLTTIKRELLMSDHLNDLAAKIYLAHKEAFDFILENRPDPASILYPYFAEELKGRGFEIGSRNKGYIRFTTNELNQKLPRVGSWWAGREIFLFEIDYFWSDQNAVAKAIISPGDEPTRDLLLKAAQSLKQYRKPEGKKWLVFFTKKSKFVASEVINEDEGQIRKRVSAIVDSIVEDVRDIASVIVSAMPQKNSEPSSVATT